MATDVELDEKDDKVLVDLMWTTMAYIHQRREDVMLLKDILQNWLVDIATGTVGQISEKKYRDMKT